MQTKTATKCESKFDPMVQQLKSEEILFETDRRFESRDLLVRPVSILLPNDESNIDCFSRNISPEGICLVTPRAFSDDFEAMILVHRLTGRHYSISSNCKWCEEFGDSWYLSGWKFAEAVS